MQVMDTDGLELYRSYRIRMQDEKKKKYLYMYVPPISEYIFIQTFIVLFSHM